MHLFIIQYLSSGALIPHDGDMWADSVTGWLRFWVVGPSSDDPIFLFLFSVYLYLGIPTLEYLYPMMTKNDS